MKSMLKKKSTMLFVQETAEPPLKSHRQSNKDPNINTAQPNTTLVRRTTLMPDFRSNLLNKSSQFRQREDKKEEKTNK